VDHPLTGTGSPVLLFLGRSGQLQQNFRFAESLTPWGGICIARVELPMSGDVFKFTVTPLT
jgi:hypothetical protein